MPKHTNYKNVKYYTATNTLRLILPIHPTPDMSHTNKTRASLTFQIEIISHNTTAPDLLTKLILENGYLLIFIW